MDRHFFVTKPCKLEAPAVLERLAKKVEIPLLDIRTPEERGVVALSHPNALAGAYSLKSGSREAAEPPSPTRRLWIGLGLGSFEGIMGGLLGVGGVFIVAPLLIFLGFPTMRAVATTSFIVTFTGKEEREKRKGKRGQAHLPGKSGQAQLQADAPWHLQVKGSVPLRLPARDRPCGELSERPGSRRRARLRLHRRRRRWKRAGAGRGGSE
jgi:hypothetical protein